MKNINLKRRTEAIGDVDGVQVIWDAKEGPYAFSDKGEIHLPPISDSEITDDDVMMIRGYCDHEIRHTRHSKNKTLERREAEKKDGMLRILTNVFEDARIEKISSGRAGEQVNIVKLRKKIRNDVVHNEYENPYSHAVTAFLYRNHNIDFDLPEDAETCYKELEPHFQEILRASSCNEVHDIAKEIVEKVKSDESEQPEPGEGEPGKGEGDGGASDERSEGSTESSNSDDPSNSDVNNGDDPIDSSDPSNADDDADNDDADTGGDTNNGDYSGKDGDSEDVGGSSGEDAEGDPKDEKGSASQGTSEGQSEVVENKIKAITADLAGADISKQIAKDIESLANGHSKDVADYTSYTDGDIFIRYQYDPDVKSQGIEKFISPETKAIAKALVKHFRSKTDTYRHHGMKRGSKVSLSRITQFAENLNDSPFYKEENSDQINAKVSILIDLSGSMGNLTKNATAFGCILAQALHQLNIDFEMIGFTNWNMQGSKKWRRLHGDSIEHYHSPFPKVYEIFHEFGDKFREKRFINIANQIVGNFFAHERRIKEYPDINVANLVNQNDDGESLYEISRRIMKASKQGEKKIVFVLSDGEPAAEYSPRIGYSSHASVRSHLKKIVNKIKEKTDIDVFAFGFSDAGAVASYYGKDNSMYVPRFDAELIKNFLKELKEKLGKSLNS
jgi:cobalamin biosynthesis protein CobT